MYPGVSPLGQRGSCDSLLFGDLVLRNSHNYTAFAVMALVVTVVEGEYRIHYQDECVGDGVRLLFCYR